MDDIFSSDCLDDDWFYESVTRYNTLQMFYLQSIPEHIVQLDEFTLCMANESQNCGKRELLALKLPTKLTMSAEDQGRSKDNDFNILSGILIEKPINKIEALRGERKILTCQESIKGLQIYSFADGGGINPEKQMTNMVSWETPNFTINQDEKKIIFSRCNHEPLIIFDINTEKRIEERHLFDENVGGKFRLSHNDFCHSNNVKCEVLEKSQIAVLDSNDGRISIIDFRTEHICSKFTLAGCENNGEYWTLSKYDYKASSSYFGILSNKGNVILYDLRNPEAFIKSECMHGPFLNFNKMKLKVVNGQKFSVSGGDSNVYIYNILKNSFEVAFIHNGHSQKSNIDDLVNDHIWLPTIGSNFVISICSNKSLNCWEFNEPIA